MKPINLYTLTRPLQKNPNIISQFEQHLSKRTDEQRIKEREIWTLEKLANQLYILLGISPLEGFYYSFKIPQIAKEFDLIKITKDIVLNIELKSEFTTDEKISKQLIQNRHYLSCLARKTILFTYIADSNEIYALDKDNQLIHSSFKTLISVIKSLSLDFYCDDIESLFRTRDFLVSPLRTPDKFIKGQYFLTDQQEEFKKNIFKDIQQTQSHASPYICQIQGLPGTGKTLLLYDIAKELAINKRVCVIHCAQMTEEHRCLNGKINNFSVIEVKRFSSETVKQYDVFITDETHRIYTKQFDMLLSNVLSENKICILGVDKGQILSKQELKRNIPDKIDNIPNICTFVLSKKVRTNVEISDFINKLLDLKTNIKTKQFNNVEVFYANNYREATEIINHYREKGYFYISYTRSNYHSHAIDRLPINFNTHYVIGQEYDNVLMALNESFQYNEHGKLEATTHPNPDYLFPKLFYQGITRVREKLALVVVNNITLFESIMEIVKQK
ncbi:MAG: DUF2075 domain-containing protein [Clostridia bacterium]|nr:DUF2075 domain-containing protein [Clostridia bacterium]